MIKYLNKIGFFSLVIFFILAPLHFWTSVKVSYFYKEIFAFLFLILTIPLLNKRTSYNIRSELFFLLLFFIYLILSSVFIESRQLYNDVLDLSQVSVSGNLYVIRNSLIYIPMLIYIYKRGLSSKEINFLLKLISVFGVISIISYLSFHEITTDIASAIKLFSLGGDFLSYNSFVPYLTFPFISSLYLSFNQPNNKSKILFLIISILIFSYIIISTSRQSMIFCFLAVLIFLTSNKKYVKSFFKLLIPLVIISIVYIPFVISEVEFSEKLTSRTSSISGLLSDETNRLDTAIDGMKKLSFIEYFVGAGVSSVTVSGPHNDYIRWTQRLGLIGSFLAFLPFLISFRKSYGIMKINYSLYDKFIFLALFYTLYISLFGYPREDAYQAPYVWLGLSFWLINQGLVRKKQV
jgi:O-antigen ligase